MKCYMKVLHVNTMANSGGAAIAAMRHCEAMRCAGIDAQMLSRFGDDNEFTTIYNPIRENKVLSGLKKRILYKLNRLIVKKTAWHWGTTDIDISHLELVKDADIIYIHWVNDFLGYSAITELLKMNKPVIWFMHDMWPITGGCHYSFSCRKYESDCKECPQMKALRYLTSNVLSKKVKAWQKYNNLIPVAPSSWLTVCIQNSALFLNSRAYNIPNVIDTDVYCPQEKNGIRRELGIPVNKKYVIVSAMGFNNPFKGMAYMVEAMLKLAVADIEFIVVGKCRLTDFPKELHQKLHLMGLIKNQRDMVNLYNSADALIITSLAENFPNVVIEAMSCGIPVVGFATGGIKDQIIHKKNGWLTEPKNTAGLVEGVRWVFENSNYKELSDTTRQTVIDRYSYQKVLDIHKPLLDLAR